LSRYITITTPQIDSDRLNQPRCARNRLPTRALASTANHAQTRLDDVNSHAQPRDMAPRSRRSAAAAADVVDEEDQELAQGEGE